MNKAIIYYTCNTHDPRIETLCRKQLAQAGLPIISVSLNKAIDFGDIRIVLHGERSPLMMHRQIAAGLQATNVEHVFLCESDVLYHPSHFDLTLPAADVVFYNTHVYKYWVEDGLIVWTDDLQQVSGICAPRELLLKFYRARIEDITNTGFNRHYEPGERYGYSTQNWQSTRPNVDIRHKATLTKSHRTMEEFRDPKYKKGFRVLEKIPDWDQKILDEIKGD